MRKNMDMEEAPKKKKMMGALKSQFTGPRGSQVHNESDFAGDEKNSKTKSMDKDSRKKMAIMIIKKKMS